MGLLSRYYKVKDSIIGIAACCTLIIAAIGNAFAEQSWELFFCKYGNIFIFNFNTTLIYFITLRIYL